MKIEEKKKKKNKTKTWVMWDLSLETFGSKLLV